MRVELGMFIASLLLPITLIWLGFVWKNNPPEFRNPMSGFWTRRTTLSRETWEFAHMYGGRIWFVMGLVALPVTVAVMFLAIRHGFMNIEVFAIIVMAVQLVAMYGTYVAVDRAIDKRFNKDGESRG